MRLFNHDIPCGCNDRKEIMFTQGNLGIPEAVIVVGAVMVVLIAWRIK